MGWNSYDAYGTTISEAQFRANARWMSQHLARYGWCYAVIDAEWFVRNPTPSGGAPGQLYALDEYGRYVPAPNRFPSAANGAGFKPLADYVLTGRRSIGCCRISIDQQHATSRWLPPTKGAPS